MRRELILTGLVAALLPGCAGYDASIKLTIEGSESLGLTAGGGYLIELRGPNGELVDGLLPVFLSYAEGEQTAGVTVRSFEPDAAVFPEDDNSAPMILKVEARAQPEAAPLAMGSARVLVRRHRPVAVTVVLQPDPRPLGGGFEMHYASEWGALATGDVGAPDSSVAILASPAAPAGQTLHAWACEPDCETGTPRWLGDVPAELDGSNARLLFVDDTEALIARELEIAITSEDLELGEGSLVLPLGYVVASGKLEEARREALAPLITTRQESVGGQLLSVPGDAVRLPQMLEVAVTHAGFAATPGRDDTYIRSHTAHVFWTLASGSPGPANLPTQSPLPDDTETRGLLGDGSVVGRMTRLDLEATAAAELSAAPRVADAALDLAGDLGAIRAALCEAWAWELYILMGSCTATPPPECSTLDCAALLAAAPDLPTAAQRHLAATEAAAAVVASFADGSPGDPVYDAIERMSLFTATAADAGP